MKKESLLHSWPLPAPAAAILHRWRLNRSTGSPPGEEPWWPAPRPLRPRNRHHHLLNADKEAMELKSPTISAHRHSGHGLPGYSGCLGVAGPRCGLR